MRFISENQFYKLREFVKNAANFLDGGYVRHSVDNEENYRVIRDGRPVTVLSCGDDNGMIYKVDESGRRKVGPIL